jgi:hypothetical protein
MTSQPHNDNADMSERQRAMLRNAVDLIGLSQVAESVGLSPPELTALLESDMSGWDYSRYCAHIPEMPDEHRIVLVELARWVVGRDENGFFSIFTDGDELQTMHVAGPDGLPRQPV